MKVSDVMTSPAITIGQETPLKDAASILAEHQISGLPVLDADGRVVGVLSEEDILRKEAQVAPRRRRLFDRLRTSSVDEAGQQSRARTVGEVMSSPAITIEPNRSVSKAAFTMLDDGIHRLPVVDADGGLLGIVTRADLVRAFARTDDEIEREIREVIERLVGAPSAQVRSTVEEGEVTLEGEVGRELEVKLLPEMARRVPGVVSVVSRLTWEQPFPAGPDWSPPGRTIDEDQTSHTTGA